MSKTLRFLSVPTGALALALAATTAAQAAVITSTLANGNFEITPVTNNDHCYVFSGYGPTCTGSLSGWTSAGGVVAINTGSGNWGSPGSLAGATGLGTTVVGLQGPGASIAQTLNLLAGTYTLTWVDAGRTGYASQDYQVLFGTTALGSFQTVSGAAWATHSLSFTTTGSTTLKFLTTSTSGDRTSFIDNVTLTAAANAVPEPGTLSVVLGGLAAAALVRRRQPRA